MKRSAKKKTYRKNIIESTPCVVENHQENDPVSDIFKDKDNVPYNVLAPINTDKDIVLNEEESTDETEEERMIQNLPSNNGVSECERKTTGNLKPETITVYHDPITGLDTPMMNETLDIDIDVDEYFKSLMSSDTLSFDVFNKAISGAMPNFATADTDSLLQLMKVVNQYMNNKHFTENYFNELPPFAKDFLFKQIGRASTKGLNAATKMFLDELSIECIKNDNTADLENAITNIKQATDEFNQDMNTIMASTHILTINSAIEALKIKIKEYEESGKTEEANTATIMLESLNRTMNLVDFKEYCSHVRVKAYDLERPDKIFDSFNMKYLTHRLTIYNIAVCPVILKRHLPHITDIQACKLCIAFCKYCINMSPDEPRDHVFMYYFIKNIITLDDIYPKGITPENSKMNPIDDQKAHEFYMNYVQILTECINNLK